MIFNRHVADRLAPYLDGALESGMRDRVDAHLAGCADCRSSLDQVRAARTILQGIPLIEAPEPLWAAIEAAARKTTKAQSFSTPIWRYAFAGLIVLAALAGYWRYSRQPSVRWEVVTLDGSRAATEFVATGAWIQTDASSRARIRVSEIGSVEVEPNTRVRLVASGATGHRIALSNGGIRASISAPPRLFFVETPAGTAVDLGCEFQVHCDRTGAGNLKVSQGWVSLEWRGTESLVPAGASCSTRPGRGPGTPWFGDAPAELIQALERFDSNPNSGPHDIDIVLARSRARDTLTLWHLLSRVQATDRSRVYDRMVQLAAAPAGITKEKILSLDRQSLTQWKDELAWTW